LHQGARALRLAGLHHEDKTPAAAAAKSGHASRGGCVAEQEGRGNSAAAEGLGEQRGAGLQEALGSGAEQDCRRGGGAA